MVRSVIRNFLFLGSLELACGRSFWSSDPASHGNRESDDYVLKTTYPLGNGRLGAMPVGPPGNEQIILNVDSLWAGGPFETSDYRGGNPPESISSALPEIRSAIFQDGTGNVDALLGGEENFGSYRVLGNLTINYDMSEFSDYRRTLDLAIGIYTTQFTNGDGQFGTTVFCSYPDDVCVYQLSSDKSLPSVSIALENQLVSPDLVAISCGERYARLTGVTQEGPPEGLKYDAIARISDDSRGTLSCSESGVLEIIPAADENSITVIIGASTNYDPSKGDAASGFSFQGTDPAEYVENITSKGAAQTMEALLERHKADFSSLESAFSLDLPDPHGSADKETATLLSDYDVARSDPFVEALLFDYSRYLLISSSRDSLPANLAGIWTEELQPAWNGDYHININLQMNYWPADQTGLWDTEPALWSYMRQTLVPRGTETARLLYNGSGWVTHHGSNIFGYTAMGSSARWANYPAAPAWMMQHVWDHFDYTQDTEWLSDIGYPLLKGVAEFWLSQLQEDVFTNDSSLVVNPCNSPEHGPTTFGCTHYQQEIHQVFEATLAGASVVGEDDDTFLGDVESAMARLDKGLHYTDWGGLKEWKLPDSYGFDAESDHRHLSHLTGWYPGYSIASFLGGYSSPEIQSAVARTLTARGNGTAADADSGWAKVWRAACWARLNDTEKAYDELRYAIERNFVGNGFSMYSGLDAPFQIDANFGLGGAVLSMLVVDMPLRYDSPDVRTVVLGPAIPGAWGGGSVKGLRIRGGGSVDFSWDSNGLVDQASLTGSQTPVRLVNREGKLLAQS